MGIFDEAKDEAENLAQKDPNLAQQVSQFGGGQQGGSQDPNQGGGYQDPNQQGGYQDPNTDPNQQGGYDPNQDPSQNQNW